MRIYAKKKLLFKNDAETFITSVMNFDDAPDWIKNTETFKLSVKDGTLQVIGDKKDQKKVEAAM